MKCLDVNLSLRLLVVSLLFVACFSQGLFPALDVVYNYAAGQPATATSTCGASQAATFCALSQTDSQCAQQPVTCNMTCPHGVDRPLYQDVLQGAQLHGGVSSCPQAPPMGRIHVLFFGAISSRFVS